MSKFENLTNEELDILREMGNIGVGNASTALATMLGRPINITVPEVYLLKFSNLDKVIKPDEIVVGTVVGLSTMDNDNSGFLYMIFPQDSPNKLAELLIGDSSDESMVESTIMEISNILASHFCDGIANMLDTVLIPTPPSYAKDYSVAVIDALLAQIADKTDNLIIFETDLVDQDNTVNIFLMLIPTEKFFEYIMQLLEMVK
ncbi:chemotaxis protein CheC [Geoglobus acetivorans]|uniref:Chemotaxis protein CheC n=1 Tax=Geoglobus acetivorans TaxID=565033 RepID=A0ABZ3H3U2_GEOAI|nr:chemotaxis protein CheC [Geoglobus acetivorans]